nr:MAG TPA: hypothetical protein [Caudoviricetes sp.]
MGLLGHRVRRDGPRRRAVPVAEVVLHPRTRARRALPVPVPHDRAPRGPPERQDHARRDPRAVGHVRVRHAARARHRPGPRHRRGELGPRVLAHRGDARPRRGAGQGLSRKRAQGDPPRDRRAVQDSRRDAQGRPRQVLRPHGPGRAARAHDVRRVERHHKDNQRPPRRPRGLHEQRRGRLQRRAAPPQVPGAPRAR